MDIKAIVRSPRDAIENHWASVEACDVSDSILSLAAEIKLVIAEIKAAKSKKQLCAKAFKAAHGEPDDLASLKAQMQTISGELKTLEKKRKANEQQLAAYFEVSDPAEQRAESGSIAKPKQFMLAPNVTDSAIDIDSISVSEIGGDLSADWDSYVEQHPNAALYHRYNWRLVIERSFHHQNHYFAAIDVNKKIVGILPTTRLTSSLFGDFAVAMPYFNYGGVLANGPDVSRKLLDYAAGFYEKLGAKHLEVRSTAPDLCSWPVTTDKVSMVRALPKNAELLGKELGAKIRSQIKRAQRESVEIEIGKMDLLNQFYHVFAINMRDLGTPVYSKSFFANILRQWPELATIVVIKVNGRPVATAFLLSHGDMLEIPWASTLKEANPMSINMLLYWEVLSFAIRTGHTFFDFGRSSKEANTYRFKKQWGAQPIQHHWYYWLREGEELPKLKPDNPKFAFLIKAWRLMPVALTKLLGPSIVKNLP
jgi:serine/alanine adding enzyme